MPELPLAPVDRLIRKAGASRVSENAAEALREILEEIAIEVSREAIELANHAERKTVTADDIKLAAKRLLKMIRYGV
ncbi:MAG: histone family protein [archaeon GB-1867-035]|nr:histone family protein [Candidatus Culexmicrobium profundum]